MHKSSKKHLHAYITCFISDHVSQSEIDNELPIGLPLGFEVGSDGNWYFRSTIQVTRAVAREICESAPGGKLATPETEAETAAILGYKSKF